MTVWIVMKEVPYEGGSFEGAFATREGARKKAYDLCQERIGRGREPYYDKRGLHNSHNVTEWYHDGDVEWWFYETEVQN